jgi:cytosine deaminase
VDLPPGGTVVGADADLVIFSASTLDDVLRNVAGRRITLKRGRIVGGLESRTWVAPDPRLDLSPQAVARAE